MKCVMDLDNGYVDRVTEKNAATLVRAGIARYCPKHEWKRQQINLREVGELGRK